MVERRGRRGGEGTQLYPTRERPPERQHRCMLEPSIPAPGSDGKMIPCWLPPNGPRVSCGALKKNSFPNLRVPPASSAC